jgi:hypothetical protein
MKTRWQRWAFLLLASAMGGWVFQVGCLRNVQNELDVFFSPESMLNYAHQSWLVNNFPGVLKFWPTITNWL